MRKVNGKGKRGEGRMASGDRRGRREERGKENKKGRETEREKAERQGEREKERGEEMRGGQGSPFKWNIVTVHRRCSGWLQLRT